MNDIRHSRQRLRSAWCRSPSNWRECEESRPKGSAAESQLNSWCSARAIMVNSNLFWQTRSLTQAREDHLTYFLESALECDAAFRECYQERVLQSLAAAGVA